MTVCGAYENPEKYVDSGNLRLNKGFASYECIAEVVAGAQSDPDHVDSNKGGNCIPEVVTGAQSDQYHIYEHIKTTAP